MKPDKFKKRTPQLIANELLTATLPITYPLKRDGGGTFTNTDTLPVFLTEYMKGHDIYARIFEAILDAQDIGDTKTVKRLKDLQFRLDVVNTGMIFKEAEYQAQYESDIKPWDERRLFPQLVETIKLLAQGKNPSPVQKKTKVLKLIESCVEELCFHKKTNHMMLAIENNPASKQYLGDMGRILGAAQNDKTIQLEDAKIMLEGEKYVRTATDKDDANSDAARAIYTLQSENLVIDKIVGLLEELQRVLTRSKGRGR
jgi:hypothetical protein